MSLLRQCAIPAGYVSLPVSKNKSGRATLRAVLQVIIIIIIIIIIIEQITNWISLCVQLIASAAD